MATPGATTKGNLESGPVHADGGAPRRRWRAPRRVAARPRHTRSLAAAFPHLPPSLLGEMAQSLEEERFGPGEVIVREGDPAGRFYIIESGQVEAAQSAAEGDVHLRTMGAGEYFGEVGLLATSTRTATVRAVSEVRVLGLDRSRFQALVDASEPAAQDLAQAVTDRNVPAQPRADRIPLPAWTGRLRRLLKAPWAMHYNRLIVLVLAANAVFAVYGADHWEHYGPAPGTVAVITQANIALAIIFRQQYVINFLGWLATRPPVTWPVKVRWTLAKFYHFGGLHVGFALAGTVWYLAFVAMLIYGFAAGKGGVGVAVVAVSLVAASLIVVIVVMARPSSRTKRHDSFEATHRFLGWAVLVLVWVNTIVFTASRAHGSATSALLTSPAFWLLVITACGTAWPWLLLRKVPVTVERPSSHLAILHLDQDLTPAARHDPRDQPQPAVRMAPVRERPGRGRVRRPRVPDDRLPGRRLDGRADRQPTRARLGPRHPDRRAHGRQETLLKGRDPRHRQRHRARDRAPALRRDALTTGLDDPRSGPDLRRSARREILTAQPDAIIWDTDELGRPDVLRLAYRAYITSGAEAVICVSNKTLTWQVVHGLEQRGIPAFGPVWDS